MSRKETEAEASVLEKWKEVTKTREAYNESLLPADDQKEIEKSSSTTVVPNKTPPGGAHK